MMTLNGKPLRTVRTKVRFETHPKRMFATGTPSLKRGARARRMLCFSAMRRMIGLACLLASVSWGHAAEPKSGPRMAGHGYSYQLPKGWFVHTQSESTGRILITDQKKRGASPYETKVLLRTAPYTATVTKAFLAKTGK